METEILIWLIGFMITAGIGEPFGIEKSDPFIVKLGYSFFMILLLLLIWPFLLGGYIGDRSDRKNNK